MTKQIATPESLSQLVGSRVLRVSRIFYQHEGDLDRTRGPLQLHFDDGTTIMFDVARDGERLSLDEEEWIDPFRLPLTPENAEFVRVSGKWTAIEIGDDEPWHAAIDSPLEGIVPILSPNGATVGVVLAIGKLSVEALIEGDEIFVGPRLLTDPRFPS
ncbi:MAG: hypothetical protein WCF24_04750 [Acidimicrobiales bacterium]